MNLFFDSLLGDELREVWAVTVGLCDSGQPVGGLRDAIDALETTPEALPARRAAEIMHRHARDAGLSADAEDAEIRCRAARIVGLCTAVERLDKDFLRELKLLLVKGLAVFEALEDRTVDDGGAALVACLRTVTEHVSAFHRKVGEELRGLGVIDEDGMPTI